MGCGRREAGNGRHSGCCKDEHVVSTRVDQFTLSWVCKSSRVIRSTSRFCRSLSMRVRDRPSDITLLVCSSNRVEYCPRMNSSSPLTFSSSSRSALARPTASATSVLPTSAAKSALAVLCAGDDALRLPGLPSTLGARSNAATFGGMNMREGLARPIDPSPSPPRGVGLVRPNATPIGERLLRPDGGSRLALEVLLVALVELQTLAVSPTLPVSIDAAGWFTRRGCFFSTVLSPLRILAASASACSSAAARSLIR